MASQLGTPLPRGAHTQRQTNNPKTMSLTTSTGWTLDRHKNCCSVNDNNYTDYRRCLQSMHSRVFANSQASVCPSYWLTAAVVADEFAAECPVGMRYWSTAADDSALWAGDTDRQLSAPRVAYQLQAHPAATALSSKCGQCHVDSRGTRLNTDLLMTVTVQTVNSNVFKTQHRWNRLSTAEITIMHLQLEVILYCLSMFMNKHCTFLELIYWSTDWLSYGFMSHPTQT